MMSCTLAIRNEQIKFDKWLAKADQDIYEMKLELGIIKPKTVAIKSETSSIKSETSFIKSEIVSIKEEVKSIKSELDDLKSLIKKLIIFIQKDCKQRNVKFDVDVEDFMNN